MLSFENLRSSLFGSGPAIKVCTEIGCFICNIYIHIHITIHIYTYIYTYVYMYLQKYMYQAGKSIWMPGQNIYIVFVHIHKIYFLIDIYAYLSGGKINLNAVDNDTGLAPIHQVCVCVCVFVNIYI